MHLASRRRIEQSTLLIVHIDDRALSHIDGRRGVALQTVPGLIPTWDREEESTLFIVDVDQGAAFDGMVWVPPSYWGCWNGDAEVPGE